MSLIRVMPEYTSTGLWDAATGLHLEVPEHLGMRTKELLSIYCGLYDNLSGTWEGSSNIDLDGNANFDALGRYLTDRLNANDPSNTYVFWKDLSESAFNQKECWVG